MVGDDFGRFCLVFGRKQMHASEISKIENFAELCSVCDFRKIFAPCRGPLAARERPPFGRGVDLRLSTWLVETE